MQSTHVKFIIIFNHCSQWRVSATKAVWCFVRCPQIRLFRANAFGEWMTNSIELNSKALISFVKWLRCTYKARRFFTSPLDSDSMLCCFKSGEIKAGTWHDNLGHSMILQSGEEWSVQKRFNNATKKRKKEKKNAFQSFIHREIKVLIASFGTDAFSEMLQNSPQKQFLFAGQEKNIKILNANNSSNQRFLFRSTALPQALNVYTAFRKM